LQNATKSLVATALAHFVNDGTLYIFPMLYPVLIKSYGFNEPLVGFLASLTSLFAIIAAPFVGLKSDRSQNYGYLMMMGLVLMAVGTLGYAFSVLYLSGIGLFAVLVPFTILVGVGSSFYHPLGASILNEEWDAGSRGRAMGINGSMGSFGVTIFPIITVALVVTLAIKSIAILAAVSIVAALVIARLLQGSSRFGSPQSVRSERAAAERSVSLRTLLPIVLILTVVTFIRGLIQGVVVFLPTYLQIVKGVDYAYLGLAVAIMPAMGIFSQPSFGYVSDHLGRRLALGITGVGVAVALLLFLSVRSLFLGEVFLAMFGFFNFTSFPVVLGLATEIAPEGAKTITSSIVWGVGTTGGGALGPILVAVLALPGVLGTLSNSFYVVTLITLTSVALLPFVSKPTTRKREADQPDYSAKSDEIKSIK
jgi:FSR family fosmidomycin resistance protein-like MFS transporter